MSDRFWSMTDNIMYAYIDRPSIDMKKFDVLIKEYNYLKNTESIHFDNIKEEHNEQLVGYYLIEEKDIISYGENNEFISSINLTDYKPIWVYQLILIDRIEFIDYTIIERDNNFNKLYD